MAAVDLIGAFIDGLQRGGGHRVAVSVFGFAVGSRGEAGPCAANAKSASR